MDMLPAFLLGVLWLVLLFDALRVRDIAPNRALAEVTASYIVMLFCCAFTLEGTGVPSATGDKSALIIGLTVLFLIVPMLGIGVGFSTVVWHIVTTKKR